MRGRLFLAVLACLVVVAPAATISDAGASSSATLSQPLQNWLSTASATDRFNTVITFHERSGFSTLDGIGVSATKLKQLPVAFAKLTPSQIGELSGSSSVRSLWHEQQMELYLDESVALTKAAQVQVGSGLKTPYTGTGVSVAVIDTGTDGLHPDLPAGAKMEGYANAGDIDLFDSGKTAFDLLVPAATGDTYGHGTHVSSTVAGLGAGATGEDGDGDGDPDRFVGMAPGAKIYSFKTDVGAILAGGWILASFDWILQHNADVASGAKPGPKILVSTNSWGCCYGRGDYRPDDPVNVATKALYDTGVTVLFAAGNSGGPNTLNQYATSPWVISVAAGTKDLALASFSSRGRFDNEGGTVDTNWNRRTAQQNNSGIYRPTLTAPGEDIEAAKSSQAAVMASGTDPSNPLYTYASGTSMATPHVAGAVALMLQARPALKPQHVIDILEGTADDMPAYELFEVGMGHLDALEAVQAAEKGKVRFPPSVNGATPQFTQTSGASLSGVANTSTWLLRPDVSSDSQAVRCANLAAAKQDPLFSFHSFNVASGSDAVYTEIEWASETQLIYLVLYAPDCTEAGVSAALLDIGAVRHRALLATNPQPGTWTVGVYGRLNVPTEYTGAFRTYDKK